MASTYNDRVAAEVRAEMARQRLTQQDLEKVLGVSRQAISTRLRGEVAFTTDEIEKIAQALNVPLGQFANVAAGQSEVAS